MKEMWFSYLYWNLDHFGIWSMWAIAIQLWMLMVVVTGGLK